LNALCNIPLTAKSKTAPEFILVPPLRTKNGFSEDVSSQAFECMLKYVYYGEEEIPPPIACELIAFATDYGMKELRTLCFRKLRHGITKESVMQVRLHSKGILYRNICFFFQHRSSLSLTLIPLIWSQRMLNQ
jgi:hypothetical protein